MDNKIVNFLKYLYPTDEISHFLINDVYQEFQDIIPSVKCFGNDNIISLVREKNYKYIQSSILIFFNTNPAYNKELLRLYKIKNVEDIIEKLIIGYVFYLVNKDETSLNVDIFKNKKSVCYTTAPTILDIL